MKLSMRGGPLMQGSPWNWPVQDHVAGARSARSAAVNRL